MKEISFNKICQYIPHRPPTLLINKVEIYSVKSGRGFYTQNTTLPILRLMEGIFQTAGVIRNYHLYPVQNAEKRLLSIVNDVKLFCDMDDLSGDYIFEVNFVKLSKKFDQFTGIIYLGDNALLTCNAFCGGF